MRLGYLFLTIQFALFLGVDDYPWMMSNPITQTRICYYSKIHYLSVNYNKSMDVGKPYIHYIAVKVMNKVSWKAMD
jgi:hypothetical protein